MRKLLCIVGSGLLAFTANAFDRIPQQDGFSGYLFLGASSNSMETNTVASIGSADVGDERVGSLSRSPDSISYGQFTPAFGLSYTFAVTRTQIYGGTELEDFLTQDRTLGIGVRQGIGSLGNFSASLLASTGNEVWADPYVVGADREATDRKSGGVRLGWERMLESDFDVTYTKRTIELDDELSGSALGLTQAERKLLDRDGDQGKLDASYRWDPAPNHVLRPVLSYVKHDLDGDAMSRGGAQFELNYQYTGLENWELMANILAGSLKSDDVNPIFDEKQEVDRMGVSLAATYKEPFGMKDWMVRSTLSYGEEDSNIDFYDSSLKSLNLGLMCKF